MLHYVLQRCALSKLRGIHLKAFICVPGFDTHCPPELWWLVRDTHGCYISGKFKLITAYNPKEKNFIASVNETPLLSLRFLTDRYCFGHRAGLKKKKVISTKHITGVDNPVAAQGFAPRYLGDASWWGQPPAAGGELSGMKSSPQTTSTLF